MDRQTREASRSVELEGKVTSRPEAKKSARLDKELKQERDMGENEGQKKRTCTGYQTAAPAAASTGRINLESRTFLEVVFFGWFSPDASFLYVKQGWTKNKRVWMDANRFLASEMGKNIGVKKYVCILARFFCCSSLFQCSFTRDKV